MAQVPSRNEPDTPGEVNFRYVFEVVEEVGYRDWVGCEYKPLSTSKDGLGWIKRLGYSLWTHSLHSSCYVINKNIQLNQSKWCFHSTRNGNLTKLTANSKYWWNKTLQIIEVGSLWNDAFDGHKSIVFLRIQCHAYTHTHSTSDQTATNCRTSWNQLIIHSLPNYSPLINPVLVRNVNGCGVPTVYYLVVLLVVKPLACVG